MPPRQSAAQLPLVGNGATVLASSPLLDLSQGWNNAAAVFTGFKFAVTPTAADASSKIVDLLSGATTVFSIRYDGNVFAPGGISQAGASSTATSGSNSLNTFYFAPQPVGANTASFTTANFSLQYAGSGNTTGAAAAVVGKAELFGTTSVDQLTGVQGIAQSNGIGGAYTASSMYGGRFQSVVAGTRTFTNAIAVRLDSPSIAAATSVAIGLDIADMAASLSAAVTRSYAVLIEGSGAANAIAWSVGGGTTATMKLYPSSSSQLTWEGVTTFSIPAGGIAQLRSSTVTSGSLSGNTFYLAPQPAGANTASFTTANFSLQYAGSGDSTGGGAAVVGKAELFGSTVIDQLTGVQGIAQSNANGGTYTSASLYGGRFQARVQGTRAFTHVLAVKFDAPQINGNATFVAGAYVQDQTLNITGGATVAQSFAVFIEGNGKPNSIGFSGTGASSGTAWIYSTGAAAVTFEIPDPTFSAGLRIGGATGPTWTSGNGSPEGVITAPIGSFYSRLNGGAGTTFYVKESGAGNTGWVAK